MGPKTILVALALAILSLSLPGQDAPEGPAAAPPNPPEAPPEAEAPVDGDLPPDELMEPEPPPTELPEGALMEPEPAPLEPATDQRNIRLVHTPARRTQHILASPNAVSLLDRETICLAPAAELVDVLRLVPGLGVAWLNGNRVMAEVRGIRSPLHANKTAVYLDGIPVGAEWTGAYAWNRMPLLKEEIQEIEVIRGSAATMYGSGAGNGAIAINTEFFENLEPSITVRAGNAERIDFDLVFEDTLGEKFRYRVCAGYHSSDWFDDVDHNDINDSREQHILGFIGRYERNERSVLDVGFRVNSGTDRYPDVDDPERLGVPAPSEADGVSSLLYAKYRYNYAGDDIMALKVYYKTFDMDTDAVPLTLGLPPFVMEDSFEVTSETLGLEWEGTRRLSINNRMVAGWDVRFLQQRSSLVSGVGEDAPVRMTAGGAFAENAFSHGMLTLVTGLRYDRTSYMSGEFLPRIAAVLATTPRSSVRFALARSARFPSPTEFYFDWVRDTNTVMTIAPDGPANVLYEYVGDPLYDMDDVGAETSLSFEAGYRHLFGTWAEFNVEYYASAIDGLLGLETLSGPAYDSLLDRYVQDVRVANVGDAVSQGLEVSFANHLNANTRVMLGLSLTALDIEDSDALLSPRLTFSSGLYYVSPPGEHRGFFYTLVLQFSSKLEDDAGTTSDTYTKLDTRVGFSPFRSTTRFSFAIQNLIGENHEEYFADAVPVNTQYQATLSYSF